jgi:chitin disaccharide deacetylase
MRETEIFTKPWNKVILCADDYAISGGVSDAIEQLVEVGHLSATSAIVTGRNWHRHGARLARIRERIAVGLHLNFTLGAPLGSMDSLALKAQFPTIGELSCRALCRKMDAHEIAAETERQIARYMEVVGELPDFFDGHQHAHALPGVRRGVLAALADRFATGFVLVRDPADNFRAIVRRGAATRKAIGIALLAHGFGEACRRAGVRTNVGFSGFMNFGTAASYAEEFPRFFICPGPHHLIMCHPGFSDAELARLDPITGRREEEFLVIRKASWLKERIWRPQRGADTIWAPEPTKVPA